MSSLPEFPFHCTYGRSVHEKYSNALLHGSIVSSYQHLFSSSRPTNIDIKYTEGIGKAISYGSRKKWFVLRTRHFESDVSSVIQNFCTEGTEVLRGHTKYCQTHYFRRQLLQQQQDAFDVTE